MKFTAKSLAASAAMLLVLAGCGGAPPAAPLHGSMLQPQAKPAAAQCDFTAIITPASATITSGQSAYFRDNLQSLGLQGTINVLVSNVSPKTKYEPSFREPAYDIHLPLNGTGFAQIIASANDKTVKTTYTVTVKAQDITDGCGYGITHYVTFMLTVT
jgi:hypothetical protein